MNLKPSQNIVAIVSLLVFLLTGQTSVQGYVWCLGEDGHSALKAVEGTSCCPEDVAHDISDDFSSLPLDNHCGPCMDIPPAHEVTSSHHKKFKDEVDADDPAYVSRELPSLALFKTLGDDHFPQPPPRISQTILAHRTVVLLN